MTDRHHLLEIILWPNGDGTFRTIINSKERLKELGIYDDYKLTIPLDRSEHIRLHNLYRSVETKAKMCASQKGNTNGIGNKGKKHSDEFKAKISAAKKGKKRAPFSEETRVKMSVARKGRKFSSETRSNMSDSHKGKHWHLENGKRVWTD